MSLVVRSPAFVLLAAAACATVAHADIIRITATGTIHSTNMAAFASGQSMTIVFEYESNGSPQLISNQQAFYVDHMRSISFSSGAWNTSATGTFGQINKYNNLGNTDGISFQVAANPLTYQYTNPKPQGVNLANAGSSVFQNAFINFASFSSSVWNNYALPTSYNFNDFDQTQNALFGFNNGSFSVGWHTVQAEVVPVPGAGLLFAAAMAGTRRRRTR